MPAAGYRCGDPDNEPAAQYGNRAPGDIEGARQDRGVLPDRTQPLLSEFSSYHALIQEVAKHTDRIKITDAGQGGISVSYIPKDEE